MEPDDDSEAAKTPLEHITRLNAELMEHVRLLAASNATLLRERSEEVNPPGPKETEHSPHEHDSVNSRYQRLREDHLALTQNYEIALAKLTRSNDQRQQLEEEVEELQRILRERDEKVDILEALVAQYEHNGEPQATQRPEEPVPALVEVVVREDSHEPSLVVIGSDSLEPDTLPPPPPKPEYPDELEHDESTKKRRPALMDIPNLRPGSKRTPLPLLSPRRTQLVPTAPIYDPVATQYLEEEDLVRAPDPSPGKRAKELSSPMKAVLLRSPSSPLKSPKARRTNLSPTKLGQATLDFFTREFATVRTGQRPRLASTATRTPLTTTPNPKTPNLSPTKRTTLGLAASSAPPRTPSVEIADWDPSHDEVPDSQDDEPLVALVAIPRKLFATALLAREWHRQFLAGLLLSGGTTKLSLTANPITQQRWVFGDFVANKHYRDPLAGPGRHKNHHTVTLGLTKLVATVDMTKKQYDTRKRFYSMIAGPEDDPDEVMADFSLIQSQMYDKVPLPPGFMRLEFPTIQEAEERQQMVAERQTRRLRRRLRLCVVTQGRQQTGEFVFAEPVLNEWVVAGRFVIAFDEV